MLSHFSRAQFGLWSAALACANLVLLGCGTDPLGGVELGQVTGKVTLDGKPLAGAQVTFKPAQGKSSTCLTDTEGNYTLRYITGYDGAIVGSHKVEIRKVESVQTGEGEKAQTNERQVVPKMYNSKTTLSAEVKPGSNQFDFDLKAGPAPSESSQSRSNDA